MIQETISLILQGKDLTREAMSLAMEEIMTGRVENSEIVSFLKALAEKGETADELTAAVMVMRKHVTKIRSTHKVVLDTCGTGGDVKGTFNISTAVAFVASGCGIAVAKHGNRSVSSRCGSADILEALGINLHMAKDQLETCLNQVGIAFLFAQNLHPAMKYAMPARKEIGAKTMFNLLGPMTNPAGATHQLIGVYDSKWTEILARVLGNLGSEHAMVVHGEDGLDEITTTAPTKISEVHKGKIRTYVISPEEFGFKRAKLEDLRGGDAAMNVKILSDVLEGKKGPQRDVVVLNAAAAVYTAGRARSIQEGIIEAQESIDTGRAKEKLNQLKECSKG